MLRPELLVKKSHRRVPLPLSLLIAASFTLSVPVNACGPDFVVRLLDDRNSTLLYMPEGNFLFEAGRLVDVDKQLPLQKETVEISTQEARAQMSDQERQTSDVIDQMRASNSLEQADALSKGLTAEERLYTLGAVAFKLMDPSAADYFNQVLALPSNEQKFYGLDAQYSLGRALMGDYSTENQDGSSVSPIHRPDEAQLRLALAAFQKVIDRVKNGEADETSLSLSSLGQQARVHIWLGDMVTATHLYAQQAAQGDYTGSRSLRYISSTLMNPKNEHLVVQAIKDPLVQQLMTIQLFTNNWGWLDYERESEKPKITAKIIALIGSSASTGFKGSDRLAALAYRSGEYDMAAALLKSSGDSALSWWLRAKMALRSGDEKAATVAYAKAAAGFPASELWGYTPDIDEGTVSYNMPPACRVAGEQGILALNRGDYLQAMELFYRSNEVYRADVMDIAERVLTLDELKGFVDKNVPAVAELIKKGPEEDYYYGMGVAPAVELREVLARRLMRAGRYDDALAYFQFASHQQWAKQYIDSLKVANNLKADKLTRAQAYYQAALLLRNQGVELISYEMTPDYAIYGADYSYVGDSYDTGRKRRNSWLLDEAAQGSAIQAGLKSVKAKTWISASEASRAKSELPKTNNNYLHYRWKAVDLAVKSADLLPPKSQAYAAVLCKATGWIINRDRKGGLKLYQRYIKNGAAFDWAPQFGYQCPDPDFIVKR
ncbi:hypothetical protein [Budvicia diplopodorum]|uniref:hypothetical protein n=1 Tax=Budvicia diplopodorum TaxID=1119056 RepID=UPI001356ECC0|nr:hypothetical protein [Budvicia diplopodorum]